ncbi:hypothetical protein [Bacteroides sedimenti]
MFLLLHPGVRCLYTRMESICTSGWREWVDLDEDQALTSSFF